jgi:hypothetical protein
MSPKKRKNRLDARELLIIALLVVLLGTEVLSSRINVWFGLIFLGGALVVILFLARRNN